MQNKIVLMSKYYNEYSLNEVLNLMVNDLDIQQKLNEVKIKELWPMILGKEVAEKTNTIRLNEGVLWVKIDAASLKQELNYAKEEIIVLINNKLNGSIVEEIIVY